MGRPATLTILDVPGYGDKSVGEYGIETAYGEYQEALDIYNRQSVDMYSTLVQGETVEPKWAFGGMGTNEYVDYEFEYGRPDAVATDYTYYEMGLPLGQGGMSKQWTERYLKLTSVQRFNAELNTSLQADARWLRKQVGAALFGNNNFVYRDKYIKNIPLQVKRLLNGDNLALPIGPDGQTFNPANQNHYRVIAAVTDAAMTGIENELLEHVTTGNVIHLINKAQETAVRALTNFNKALDPRLVQNMNVTVVTADLQSRYEHNTNLNDRFVGITEDGGEYWVKPWIPQNYGFSYLINSNLEAPLMRRRDPFISSDMEMKNVIVKHEVLDARVVGRRVGFGVVERRNGVCWKVDAQLGAYTPPVIFTV